MSKSQRNIILFWAISWMLLCNLFVVYRFIGLRWTNTELVFTAHEWIVLFSQANLVGLMSGILFGISDVRVSNKNILHRMSFGKVILIKTLVGFGIAAVALFITVFLGALANGFTLENAFKRAVDLYSSVYFLVMLLYLVVNLVLLNFIRQVSEKFGPGNLARIFFGSYYKPIEEERIFMFLDLRSSTQYAEMLGHVQFSQLIQDCFYDITPVVHQFKAEIYQYVGDEVVLSWPADDDAAYQQAILLFFAFQEQMKSNSNKYLKKYGFIPEFKAGVNAGEVTVAEVGVVKKEIAYHGDVLNTAARIQGECNTYNRLLLCSEYFITKLKSKTIDFKIELINEVLLKGKKNPINIYGIDL